MSIADVQEERREIVRRTVNRHYGNEDCIKCRDMFEVLDRDDIDAVLITTGDRWHTLGTILAARAGKDIYCEKPCSMTVQESQELADAVTRYSRVFQAGTQRRNVENFQFAAHLAQTGKLGAIQAVHAGILLPQLDVAPLPEQPEPDPEVCDWDGWLGPAPWRPYHKDYVRGRWRHHHDFHAGAGLPEWGSHTLDLCQWAAEADETMPVDFDYDQKSQTGSWEGGAIVGRYENGVQLVMRQAGFHAEGDWNSSGSCPVRFEGEEGWVEASDNGEVVASADMLLEGKPENSLNGGNPVKHVREFLDCVKTREKPASNADITRRGHIACHVAAIGWQLGRKVQFDPVQETFLNDDEANRMCSKPRRKPWDTSLKSSDSA